MKPVEYVSIGGCVFSLEEDACVAARAYLDELETFYSGKESGAEIMEGIEERMSELFMEQTGNGGVVTLPMVEGVVATLGRPEAIEEESGDAPGTAGDAQADSREPKKEDKVQRKLYRDPSQGKLAGVCSGLGVFFGVDPTIFRLGFVIFSMVGFGLLCHRGGLHLPDYLFPLLYLVLWICMPVAKTVRQRDELRGERGTVDAISARVRSSVHEMGEAAGAVAGSTVWGNIWRILEVCLGIIMLVTGVAGVVSLGCVSIGNNFLTGTYFYNQLLEEIAAETPWVLELLSFPPLVVCLAITVVIPFIALIYWGVMLLFDLRAPKWHPGLCLLVVWLVAVTVLAVLTTLFMFRGSF